MDRLRYQNEGPEDGVESHDARHSARFCSSLSPVKGVRPTARRSALVLLLAKPEKNERQEPGCDTDESPWAAGSDQSLRFLIPVAACP